MCFLYYDAFAVDSYIAPCSHLFQFCLALWSLRLGQGLYAFGYFPFGFEGRIWDLTVSVPDHCLAFYFLYASCAFVCLLSCLLLWQAIRILDRFCFGLRLIQAPNKPAGCHSGSGTCRAKPSRTRTFRSIFRPGHLVPLFGSPRPIFYNGVGIINAILLCVKIYFLNLLLYKKRTLTKCILVNFII